MLSFSINDATSLQVVRRDFDNHAVARHDSNEVFTHFSGDMRHDLMAVFKLNPEHRIGQQLDDAPAHFEKFFLGHVIPYV